MDEATFKAIFATLAGNLDRQERRGLEEADPMSPREVDLLAAFLELGLDPILQHPVGPYDCDFFFERHKVCVEVDGKQHLSAERMGRDKRRDAYMRERGIRTIRFTTTEVREDAKLVAYKVAEELHPGIATPYWRRRADAEIPEPRELDDAELEHRILNREWLASD